MLLRSCLTVISTFSIIAAHNSFDKEDFCTNKVYPRDKEFNPTFKYFTTNGNDDNFYVNAQVKQTGLKTSIYQQEEISYENKLGIQFTVGDNGLHHCVYDLTKDVGFHYFAQINQTVQCTTHKQLSIPHASIKSMEDQENPDKEAIPPISYLLNRTNSLQFYVDSETVEAMKFENYMACFNASENDNKMAKLLFTFSSNQLVLIEYHNGANSKYVYTISRIGAPSPSEVQTLLHPTDGVVCDGFGETENTTLKLRNSYVMGLETIIYKQDVKYSTVYYDYTLKLARYDLDRSNADHGFPPVGNSSASNPIRVIHDFASGYKFTMDLVKRGKFSVEAISSKSNDAYTDSGIVKMRLPETIYDFADMQLQYSINVRGIPCDVYVKNLQGDRSSFEVCFAKSNGEYYPLRTRIFLLNPTAGQMYPTLIQTQNMFLQTRFNPVTLSDFDVSSCFNEVEQMFITINGELDNHHSLLTSFSNPYLLKHTLVRNLAMTFKIEVLRITNFGITVQSPPKGDKSKQTIEMHFTLLDFARRVNIPGKASLLNNDAVFKNILTTIKKEPTIGIAFEIAEYNINEPKNVKYTITLKSAQETSSSHWKDPQEPQTHSKSNTSSFGSTVTMIIISMLVLITGCGIGLLVGFKLWKSGGSFGYMIHTNI